MKNDVSMNRAGLHKKIRLLFQFGILLWLAILIVRFLTGSAVVDFEAYCPFGGMQAFSSYLVLNSLACSMTSIQIVMASGLMLCVILFGKLFCSYICPLGSIAEWIGKAGSRITKRFEIKGFADMLLRFPKYLLLFITLYFTSLSGELFCKKYDPYYASMSGFSSDVVIIYAMISISLFVLLSLFLRMAWCRYLCPLGAVTNIFSNILIFVVLVLIYVIFVLINIDVSWVWLLAAIVLSGFIKEAITLQVKPFPILKITRNREACSLCNKCNRACCMGINVSESDTVYNIDCHLCGDCINACPEKDALNINRRKLNWLPPFAIVFIFVSALFLSSYISIPTVSQRWGNKAELDKASILEIEDLKDVKCFGSAVSFCEQMHNVAGILGVDAFAGEHRVKIFYNPELLDEEAVKCAIFIPVTSVLKEPLPTDKIGMLRLSVENYFDSYDEYYFEELLKTNDAILGYTSSFGEPVNINVVFKAGELNSNDLRELIETPEIELDNELKELDFNVAEISKNPSVISFPQFCFMFWCRMDDDFNNSNKCKSTERDSIILWPKIALNSKIKDDVALLESHLSNNPSIIGLKTVLKNDSLGICVAFIRNQITIDSILHLSNEKFLKVNYNDGSSDLQKNPFFNLY